MRSETPHQRHDPLVGVFDDVVAAVGQPMDFGLRPVLDEPLEALGPKAPVAHAPDQLNRQVGRARPGRLRSAPASATSDAAAKTECPARTDRSATRLAQLSYGASRPARTSAVIRSGFSTAIVSAARAKAFSPRTASVPSSGVRQAAIRHGTNGGGNAPVLNSTIRAEPLRQPLHGSQADRAAPIVRQQRRAASDRAARRACTRSSIRCCERVVVILRLVGQPAADVIDGDAAIAVAQAEDQVPPIERPGRVAVHEQQRLAGPFVDVVQPVRAQLESGTRRDRGRARPLRIADCGFRIGSELPMLQS